MTGEVLSISEGTDRGLIEATEGGDFITTKAIKETKSFTITSAIDPNTGKMVDVSYAVSQGIIDQANGQYVGRDMNGKEQRISISEAIKKGRFYDGVILSMLSTDLFITQ